MAWEGKELQARRLLATLAIFAIALPSVLAASAFSTSELQIDGQSALLAPSSAFFFVSAKLGGSWDATASSAVVERTMDTFVGTTQPQMTKYGDSRTVRETYESPMLSSTAFREGGALLAQVPASGMIVNATAHGAMTVRAVTNPSLDQTPPPDASVGKQNIDHTIHQKLVGVFVKLTAPGVYEITGDITLRLYDADYAIATSDGVKQEQTGRVTESSTGPVVTGRDETQVVTLTNAVLHFRAPTAATVLSAHPLVSFEGSLTATDPQGELPIPTLTPTSEGRWTGSAQLDLVPQGDAVTILPPPATLSATALGARAAATPLALQLSLVALFVAALLVTALVLLRRRERGTDHLELALLAMEERRWTEALPHLDRVLARRPHDAAILMDRALCLEESGSLDAARAGYEAALAAQPQNAELHYYYARTLARLRMTTSAMAHLTRALTLDARLAELARGESAFAAFADHPGFVGLTR